MRSITSKGKTVKNLKPLSDLKRKKIKAGHYTYAGFTIRKTKMHMCFIRGNGIEVSWNIDGFIPPPNWFRGIYSTLEHAIFVVESSRKKVWRMVRIIENQRLDK